MVDSKNQCLITNNYYHSPLTTIQQLLIPTINSNSASPPDCSTEKCHMIRISVQKGLLHAIDLALQVVAPYSNKKIAYVNNTSGSGLIRAVEASHEPWVSCPQRMQRFEYLRVSNLQELELLLDSYHVVVIERIDEILQESLAALYEEQNRALHCVMAREVHFVFLDDWEYLDKYYMRELYESAKRRKLDHS